VIFRDLVGAHAAVLDTQVLAGSGTNGQVLGITNTAGIQTVTVSSVDLPGFYKAVAHAIGLIHTTRFQPPDAIVCHPTRWAWMLSLLDTTDRPLFIPSTNGLVNVAGVQQGVVSQGLVGQMCGLPVYVDPNIPVNSGYGSNQDFVYVLRSSDLLLYESGLRARVLPETRADTLTVLLQVFSYLAASAGRYPQSVVEIRGLTAPTW
jgi:HK97 family phage major capsid protein